MILDVMSTMLGVRSETLWLCLSPKLLWSMVVMGDRLLFWGGPGCPSGEGRGPLPLARGGGHGGARLPLGRRGRLTLVSSRPSSWRGVACCRTWAPRQLGWLLTLLHRWLWWWQRCWWLYKLGYIQKYTCFARLVCSVSFDPSIFYFGWFRASRRKKRKKRAQQPTITPQRK